MVKNRLFKLNQVFQHIDPAKIKRVAFVTAIYGGYEKTCKKFVPQTIPCDFICFTDNPNIEANGWIVDTYPYHITHPSPLPEHHPIPHLAFENNKTFSIYPCIYHRWLFFNNPRLDDYEIIIYMDGTLEITNPNAAQYLSNILEKEQIILWEHPLNYGKLENEVI